MQNFRGAEHPTCTPAPSPPMASGPSWVGRRGGVPWPCVQQAPCVLVGTREWRAGFAAEPRQAQSSRPQLHKPPLAPSWARMAAPCGGKSNICQMVLWLLGAVALTVEGLSTALVQPWFPDLPITVHPASSGGAFSRASNASLVARRQVGFSWSPSPGGC